MMYWEPKTEFSKYAMLRLVDQSRLSKLTTPLFYDVPRRRLDEWQPPKVQFQPDLPDLPPFSHESSFPGLYALLAWDQAAIDLLAPLIAGSVEYLPLDCEEKAYWLVNVLDVADCLDHEQSEFYTLENDGKQGVRRYSHKHNCFDGHPIFRTPEHRYKRVFVSNAFKARVENSTLVGLKFVPAPWEPVTDAAQSVE